MTEQAGGKRQAASYKGISSGATWALSSHRNGERQGEWVKLHSPCITDWLEQRTYGRGKAVTIDHPSYATDCCVQVAAGPGPLVICASLPALPFSNIQHSQGGYNSNARLGHGYSSIATHDALEFRP